MNKLRVSISVALACLVLGAVSPASAQSLDRMIQNFPGQVLREIIINAPGPRPAPAPSPRPAPVVIDAIPATECRAIQGALSALDYPVGTVDGRCGPRTRNAIALFQERLGASPTGSLTAAQKQSLLAQATAATEPAPEPAPAPAPAPVPGPAPSDAPAAPAPLPQPAAPPAPPPEPAVPPEPEEPLDTDIDCETLPAAARSDCEVFKQYAVTAYFGPQAALGPVRQACAALADGISEKPLLDCLAGAYALREHQDIPRVLYPNGWTGLGPVLEGTKSCSALLGRIEAVASAIAGDVSIVDGTVDQADCRSLAMMAVPRRALPAWGACAMGTDPDQIYLECAPAEEAQRVGQWKSALAQCLAGKAPAAINRMLADAASSVGREAPSYSCEQIEDLVIAQGIMSADDIAAERQRIADEIAAEAERQRRAAEAAELERQRREAAAEAARVEAELERLAENSRREQLARENADNPVYGTLQVPERFEQAARSIETGETFNFTDGTMLLTAGIAAQLLEECRINLDAAARVELAAFVSAASLQAGGGNLYSAPRIQDMMADQAASVGVFTVGVASARALQCSGADQLAENIVDIVRKNKSGANGGESPFIGSCSPVHGRASCTCLAELGRASYSNIYQMSYSRDLVYGILQNNPMAGLMIAMSCGIQNY